VRKPGNEDNPSCRFDLATLLGEHMTSKPIRILGIAGSLRRESYNRAVLRAATRLVPEGAILETFEQGNLTDEVTMDFIRQLLRNLVELARRIGQP
jgi:NADPH-dependent FMN reductase